MTRYTSSIVSPSANCLMKRLAMVFRPWSFHPMKRCRCSILEGTIIASAEANLHLPLYNDWRFLAMDQGHGLRTMHKKLLAIDLGAESGRGVLGLFDGQKLRLEVVHRFPNGPVRTLDTMHWDVLRLYAEMVATLRKCATDHGGIDCLG